MFVVNHKPGKQMQAQAVRGCTGITVNGPAAVWCERPQGNDKTKTP